MASLGSLGLAWSIGSLLFGEYYHVSSFDEHKERGGVLMRIKNAAGAFRFARLAESLSVQREQAGPGLLGLFHVVDVRIRRTPAVHGWVHFDFRGQAGLSERVLQYGLIVRSLFVIAVRDRNEELS